MGWRIVCIESPAKITSNSGYLVVSGEEQTRVHFSEIDVLIIESNQVNISVPCINDLALNKVVLIICDNRHNPNVQLMPIYGHYRQSRNISNQLSWSDTVKEQLWQSIIINKISNQYSVIYKLGRFDETNSDNLILLDNFKCTVELNDSSNREGMAAKLYFKMLFGKEFVRHKQDNINWFLDYAYTLLISYFNRKLISRGVLLELGIFHRGAENNFNLSCDLLEPFRPLIDFYVYKIVEVEKDFSQSSRRKLQNIFNEKVILDGKKYFMSDAIDIYINNILDYLDSNNENLIYPVLDYEL